MLRDKLEESLSEKQRVLFMTESQKLIFHFTNTLFFSTEPQACSASVLNSFGSLDS